MREGGGARIRVGGVVSRRSRAARASASSTRAGEHRDRVDRAAGRHHAAGRDAADGRLQPDDVAERGRHAAGTGGVGAERERHDPGRDRAGGAGGRSARHAHADRTGCAARRTGCACRPGRWRTGRDWSCRPASRRHPAGAARRARLARRCRRSRGRRPWSAGRRRRCCPSPRTARPRAAGRAAPPPPARVRVGQDRVVGQAGDPDGGIGVGAVGGQRAPRRHRSRRHAASATWSACSRAPRRRRISLNFGRRHVARPLQSDALLLRRSGRDRATSPRPGRRERSLPPANG